MSLIKSKSKEKPAKQNTPRVRFHECWKSIQALEKKIARQEEKKALLLSRFDRDIRPLEEQQYSAVYAQTERLITFYEKKSLTGWQREELHEWIMEQFDYLNSHPFRADGIDFNALHARFHQHMMSITSDDDIRERLGDTEHARAMMEEVFGSDFGLSDEELFECIRDPEKFKAHAEQYVPPEDDDDDLFSEDESFDDPFADFTPRQADSDNADTDAISAVLTQSGIKLLYKKLALVLHPDREADELKKEEKAQQMGQLLEAWKNKDLYTLLSLADRHLEDHDSQFTDQHIESLLPLLKKKQLELQWQFNSGGGMAQSLDDAIFHKFNTRSKAGTERAFERHIQSLQQDIANKNSFLNDVRTLKEIKPLLEIRWEQNRFDIFSELPDEFSDFFN